MTISSSTSPTPLSADEIAALRKLPVFSITGWLRNLANMLDAGNITMYGMSIGMDNEDLVTSLRFKVTKPELLEALSKHDTPRPSSTADEMANGAMAEVIKP
jgi:hypothetical protein